MCMEIKPEFVSESSEFDQNNVLDQNNIFDQKDVRLHQVVIVQSYEHAPSIL